VLRILYITSSWPHGRSFGDQLRALHIGRALKKIGNVTVAVVSSDAASPEVLTRTADEFAVEAPVRVHVQRNRGMIRRFQWAFNPRFLNVHGCVADATDRQRLLSQLNDFDLIWVLNSRTPNILGQWHWPHSVLDINDLPSGFHRTVWQNGAGTSEKAKAGIEMRLSKRRERFWKQRFSVLSVCSEADRNHLGGGEHVYVIPNGFERPADEPRWKPVEPPRIGFIGLFSYSPNLEGVRWFLRECWPWVKSKVPGAELRLVGKDSDGPLRPDAADVEALGYLNDPADEIATWSAMIVPVLHGAGTRIKIADAFSRKCPVVSTHLGAYGYDVRNGRELLLADDPKQFAAAVVALIRDRAAAQAITERAYKAFLEKWTWDAIAPRVCAASEDALRLGSRLSARLPGRLSSDEKNHERADNRETLFASADSHKVSRTGH
jgi:glycosyltransferase involved in cell wall biosynthesis